jgi:hypothetical protein
VENDHTGTSFLTFVGVICSRGLYPQPLKVPRYISQLCGSGLRSLCSVTAV